mgnify:CR=1 FL=1
MLVVTQTIYKRFLSPVVKNSGKHGRRLLVELEGGGCDGRAVRFGGSSERSVIPAESVALKHSGDRKSVV